MYASPTASPAKLRDGTWGARVNGTVAPLDTITITTRAGKSWDAVVTRIVWQGDSVTLVATQSAPRRSSYGRSSSRYCGYPCAVTGRRCCAANGPCHDCE